MLSEAWWLLLGTMRNAVVLQVQERLYEWHWEMHPMWWWGWGMMAMMFLFWMLFIVGLIVGIRWLIGKGKEQKQDSALEILRERYARGEINKEEFEAKRKDLGG
ncbi:MAG: putative rane protein [Candidatus Binatota bacterium]|jgi:putative membrane protein|nr:putative rane protein [Candidatus Binatota bacterium]